MAGMSPAAKVYASGTGSDGGGGFIHMKLKLPNLRNKPTIVVGLAPGQICKFVPPDMTITLAGPPPPNCDILVICPRCGSKPKVKRFLKQKDFEYKIKFKNPGPVKSVAGTCHDPKLKKEPPPQRLEPTLHLKEVQDDLTKEGDLLKKPQLHRLNAVQLKEQPVGEVDDSVLTFPFKNLFRNLPPSRGVLDGLLRINTTTPA